MPIDWILCAAAFAALVMALVINRRILRGESFATGDKALLLVGLTFGAAGLGRLFSLFDVTPGTELLPIVLSVAFLGCTSALSFATRRIIRTRAPRSA